VFGKKALRNLNDFSLFGRSYSIEGMPVLVIGSGLDFNEHHRPILLGNDINFTQFTAEVLLDNSIAFFFK
jgi:hypothetical protein